MTAIQEVVNTGGLVLLALALVLWGRHRNRRPPSTIEWPIDVYLEERRRWVKTLNDERRRQSGRRDSESRRREWQTGAAV